MFINHQTCPTCGVKASKDARFCPGCGNTLGGSTRRCGKCNTDNRGDAKFCKSCGSALDQSGAPVVYANRWARSEKDFAVRIEADDLPGLLMRGLAVEPGTNAMLLHQGAVIGQVAPGKYDLATPSQRIQNVLARFTGDVAKNITALLVDVTPTDFEFNLGGVFTADPLRIGFTIRLQAEVEEPGKFLVNLLKNRERYTIDDLRQYLYPEVVAVAERWVHQYTARQLAEDFSLRAHLELALEEALRKTFAQTGLHFIQIRAVQFNLESLEKVQGAVSKAVLIDQELEAKVRLADAELRSAEQELKIQTEQTQRVSEARQRLADAKTDAEKTAALAEIRNLEERERQHHEAELRVARVRADYEQQKGALDLAGKQNYEKLQKEYDLLALAEETRKVEAEESRANLYERMRQAVMSDKMGEVRSETDFAVFLDEQDRRKLLTAHERTEMEKLWREQGEDHDKARAHLLAKLEVERNYERSAAELKSRSDLDEQALTAELNLARKRATGQIEIENVRYEFDLKRQQSEAEYERNRQRQELQLRTELAAAEMREAEQRANLQRSTGAADFDEELRQDYAQMELGITGLRKMKETRLEEARGQWELERQRMQFDWDQRRQQMEWDLQKQTRELEMELQRQRVQQEYELSRLDKLSQMGAEALISVSGAEQARIIADLKKTESLHGLSEDQILALAAKDSPEVARAFQEKYRAAAAGQLTEQERKMYERLLAEQRSADEAVRKVHEESARQTHEDANRRVQEVTEAVLKATAQGKDSADRAVDALKEVAKTYASNQSQPAAPIILNTPPAQGTPQVIYTPGGKPLPGTFGGAAAQPNAKSCPKCGKPVPFDARFCEHCGNKFEGVA